MCTVSWHRSSDQTLLYFNRDEQRTRSVALPPQVHFSRNGSRYLSPTDPDAGGTWIAGNETGLMVCLLNAYEQGDSHQKPTQSRGLLVRNLMDADSPSNAFEILDATIQTEVYMPCYVLVMSPEKNPALFFHHDQTLTQTEPEVGMLTTSSFRPDAVKKWRTKAYGTLDPTPEGLADFHDRTCPEHPAYGVLMERPDARTVSQTRMTLSQESILMQYRPLPDGPWSEIAIPLCSF